MKILFVCTINRMRSATAHVLYAADTRFEVRSAGTDSNAAVPLTRMLLDWADSVVVMERVHRNHIRKHYPDIYECKQVVCLYIPDEYDYMQAELTTLIKARFENVYSRGLI